jgi:phage terminase small subunit
MWYCEKYNIEIEAVASLIKKSEVIKAKLEAECEDQNMIQKKPRLPL